MTNNAFLFLGILVFIFILWVMTGGPNKEISFSGPYLHPIDGPGETAEPYVLGRGNASTGSKGDSPTLSELERQIGDLSSFGEVSEYRGLVSISRSPSGPRATDEEEEHLILTVSRRLSDPISLTGWRLESTASKVSAVIPAGVEVPRSGAVNPLSSIMVAPGQEVVVTSGRSPIGASFRENLCTGYLTEFQSFVPELELSCPSARYELERAGGANDDACYSYAWNIPRCTTVRNAPSELSNACEEFLENLSYNSCAAAYVGDSDFLRSRWRVFLGSDRELWRENHETIRLIDNQGKTVDVFAY